MFLFTTPRHVLAFAGNNMQEQAIIKTLFKNKNTDDKGTTFSIQDLDYPVPCQQLRGTMKDLQEKQ